MSAKTASFAEYVTVATAATDQERSLVTELGAATTVDHGGDVVEALRQAHPDGVDVVFHFAGDPAALLTAVRPGGHFVSTLVQPGQLSAENISVVSIYVNPDPATLNRLAGHQADGATRLTIQQTFPLAEAPEALPRDLRPKAPGDRRPPGESRERISQWPWPRRERARSRLPGD